MKKSKVIAFGAVALVVVLIVMLIPAVLKKRYDNAYEENKEPPVMNAAKENGPENKSETELTDAFQRIQIEKFGESAGVVVEDCSEDNGQSIGGIKEGSYTAYYNVDFGEEGAGKAVFRVATMTAGGTIEVRLGGTDGTLVGTCEVTTTGADWSTWVNAGCDTSLITGIHDVYLVYRGDGYLFNINWFRFARGDGKEVKSVILNNYAPMVGDHMTATISPANAIVGYEWLVDGKTVSIAEKYTVLPGDTGKVIRLKVNGLGYSEGVLLSEETREVVPADYEFDVELAAYKSFTGFIDKFYYYSNMNDFGLFLHTEFWDQAEIYEIVIDAYENTGHPRYKAMIYDIFKGFNLHNGSDWTYNEYNDDIMWMVIACARAFFMTGDTAFLDTARYHFDQVWDRGWSEDLGGGIWWRTDNRTKNACINCPAAIAACLLGEALGDESYYGKAVKIMEWVTANLYDPSTGQVYDAYDINGIKNTWASTYNQGTFIGANTFLYEHYGDEAYYNRARLASDYTIHTMYRGGVMSNEDSSGDLIGFKGILCRWISRFAVKYNQPDIMEWLKYNGAAAWNNRNKADLIWTTWNSKTSDIIQYDIFGLSTAVSLLNNSRTDTNLIIDASDRIEIEDFDSCRGVITEECSEGGRSIGEVADGFYTVYHNVDFGEGGFKKAGFRAAAQEQGGTVELRLGGTEGIIIGTCEITATGGEDIWETFSCEVTEVSGIQELYLIYKGTGSLFRLNWFEFVP